MIGNCAKFDGIKLFVHNFFSRGSNFNFFDVITFQIDADIKDVSEMSFTSVYMS
jgi:hypothetical protein